jgi:ABC-2 type transport system ATP-binding protein
MEIILKTTNLTKQFGKKMAVNNVNMTIEKGDIYGFIGKNGAGKTTFMRLVLGTAFSTKGSITLFNGMPLEKARHRIGSLIEGPGLYKNCTAYENLKRFSLIYGGTEKEIQEILQLIGLDNTGKKKAGKFSLGMKQRLGIGIALLGNPEFLILDEPVNGLDPAGIKEVRDLILRLNHEKKVTILISSHLLDELSKVVTKYGIINDGNLVEEVSASDLIERCKQKLTFTVNDIEKAVSILSSVVPSSDIQAEDGQIILSSHLDDAASLNKLLVQQDIEVSGIQVQTDGLEQYFMKRIGE